MSLLTNNPYIRTMKVQVKEERWSRMDFILSFVSILFESLIYYLLFHGLWNTGGKIDPDQMVFYYVLINIVSLSFQPAQFVTWRLMDNINTGKIIHYIMRPYSYMFADYMQSLASFIRKSIVNFGILFFGAMLFFHEMICTNMVYFVLSLLLGFSILYFIQAIIGCFTIWFKDVLRFRDVFMTLLMILGGRLIPSNMLFGNLKNAIYISPIPYIYDIPVKVWMGKGNITEIGYQFLWCVILAGAYYCLYCCCVQHNIEMGT